MIRTLLIGVARLLFNAAMLAFLLGVVLIYGAFRLLRAAFAKDRGQPVREASFATLISLAVLVKAVRAAMPEQAVTGEPEPEPDNPIPPPIF